MKRVKIIAVVALLFLATGDLFAQRARANQACVRLERAQANLGEARANLEEFKAELIAKQLKLESQKEKFKAIYAAYAAEMKALQPLLQCVRAAGDSLSSEEAEAQILASFKVADEMSALRQAYYPRFKEVLTPQQIVAMYRIERGMNCRIADRARGNVGARKGDASCIYGEPSNCPSPRRGR